MPERDYYQRAVELFGELPPLSEEEIEDLISATITEAEIIVLQRANDSEKTTALLRRDYNAIIRKPDFKPNPLYLACYTAMTSAGMFLEALAGDMEKAGDHRREKAFVDGEHGLIAIGIPFMHANDPSKLSSMRREAGANQFIAEMIRITGFDDLNNPEMREVYEQYQFRIRPIQESISTDDPTGFIAIDNAVDHIRMDPEDVIKKGVYPGFAIAGAELIRNYYKILYPLAERVVMADGK